MPALFIAALVIAFGLSLMFGGCYHYEGMEFFGFIGFCITIFGCERFARVYDKLYVDNDDSDEEDG